MKKIVVLDAAGFGYGIDFHKFEKYGEVTVYETSTIEETAERVRDAGAPGHPPQSRYPSGGAGRQRRHDL